MATTTSAQVEAALRPKRLDEFPGQGRVRDQLQLVLEAARRRDAPPDHILLSGPPGLGKTTLAMIVAAELEQPIRITSGPAIQHAGDLASILSSLGKGEVLFLDEIHRMARPAEEMLYLAMEDFRVDVIVGKGPGATAIPLELAPFTARGRDDPGRPAAGAAARPVRLHRPPRLLRHRGARAPSLKRSAGLLRRRHSTTTASPRSPGAPGARPASPTGCCAACATGPRCTADGVVDGRRRAPRWRSTTSTTSAWTASTAPSWRRCAAGSAAGRSGSRTLAVAVGEEPETVETVAEPFLVREGFMIRTPRGRAATAAAWEHLGLTPPRRWPEPPARAAVGRG